MSFMDVWILWCIAYGSFTTVDLLFDIGKWAVKQVKLRRVAVNGSVPLTK